METAHRPRPAPAHPHRMARGALRRIAAALAIAVLLPLVAVQSRAQGRFRISYGVDRQEATSTVLVGTVSNDDARDVLDVWVTAEAVNASGKVIATGVAFVTSLIPAHASAAFSAKIPAVPGAQSFRVVISSFRYGGSLQSP